MYPLGNFRFQMRASFGAKKNGSIPTKIRVTLLESCSVSFVEGTPVGSVLKWTPEGRGCPLENDGHVWHLVAGETSSTRARAHPGRRRNGSCNS